MPTLVLDRPSAARNTPALPDRTQDRTASEILEGWIVQIPSRLINSDLGAVIVLALSTAWRDRRVPGCPPGGWPRLGGTSTRNWHRWRERAIELGLVEMRGSRIVPLAQLEPGEQFARVPLAVLLDPKLPRTAKRTYLSLALFRSGLGYSRASVRTLAATSGLDRSSIQRGLRELENRFHITRRGTTARGVERYFLVETPPVAPKSGAKNTPASTEGYSPNPQNGQKRGPPQGREPDKNAAPQGREPDKNAAPKRTKTRPLLQESKNLNLQERRKAQAPVESPAPRAEQQTKNQAHATLGRFGMKSPGSDFGKPAKSGPQGKAKPVVEPPTEPHWRPLRDGQIFEKNWEAETLRLGSAGLFRPATNAAVPQLPRRKKVAK